ncbi:MAG TPA: prepilin-type N-terminal cleavage/methylation domain-containing protein [Phycisphaerae bacterium]|nr:prepilin-type N-terminal cleavage/methylation domain-containing protein [Phycisphaerae bacterium]
MRNRRQGFTLIELLMVVLIIGLLVIMLVPVVSGAATVVKSHMTESRIWEIDNAVARYREVFGDFPPSGKPTGADWTDYPDGIFEMKEHLKTYSGYKYFDVDYTGASGQPGRGPGTHFLVYFLFGPNGTGWNPTTHKVSAGWTPPSGLTRYLSKDVCPNEIVSTGNGYNVSQRPYYVFEDAFGLVSGSSYQGAILYLRANPRVRHNPNDTANATTVCHYGRSSAYRWYTEDTASQWYWDCRGGPGDYSYYTGDGEHAKNLARMLRQNPKEFALISAGPNHFFGYRALNTHGQNEMLEGADWDDGSSDDITNFDFE